MSCPLVFYGYRCLCGIQCCHLVSDISMTGKAIYAAISYMIASILFYRLNTPLSAILPLMTLSPAERLVLNSPRMTGGQIQFY